MTHDTKSGDIIMLCIIIMWHKIISNEEQSSNRERYRSLMMRLDDYQYDENHEIMSRLIISLIVIDLSDN